MKLVDPVMGIFCNSPRCISGKIQTVIFDRKNIYTVQNSSPLKRVVI